MNSFSLGKKVASYKQIQEFRFDTEKSAPLTDEDDLVVLNTHMNVRFFGISFCDVLTSK